MSIKKHLLVFSLTISSIIYVNAQTIPSYIPVSGLVGWYPFNGNANDESGSNNHGIVTGALPTSDINGVQGSAYLFNGTSDFVKVNTIFDYEHKSVSCWFNCFGTTGSGNSANQILNTDTPTLLFGRTDLAIANGILYLVAGGDSIPVYSFGVNQNQWYHVVMVRDGNICQYYMDGIWVGSHTSGLLSSGSSLYPSFVIGADRSETTQFFEGKIDDVGIWDRALSAQEVMNIYSGTISGFPDNLQSNLLTVYPNPVRDVLTLELPKSVTTTELSLFDIASRKLEVFYVKNEGSTFSIPVYQIPPGIYFIRDETGLLAGKFIKM